MIYVAADIHLRECIWKARPDIMGDHFNAWAQLCVAVARDPEGVLVLAGDIFDSPYPTGLTEMAFAKGMEKIQGRPCYFIPGNHDYEPLPRPFLFGAKELTEEPVDVGGFTIAGIPFTRGTQALHDKLADIPAVDMLVMHTGFRHLLGFEETWQVTAEDIPEQVRMVMAGHVHLHSAVGKVFSPGSLALHRADEVGKGHGYYIVDPSTGAVSWREVFTRKFVSVDLDDGLDNDMLEELAGRNDLKRPVVLLNYRNDDTAKAEAIQELWKDRLLFVCNARSSETIRAIEDRPGESLDIETVVRGWLRENLGQEPFELASSLLDAQDPAAEMEFYLKGKNL